MNKLIGIILVLVVLIGGYAWFTRPAPAPSQSSEEASAKLPAGSETSGDIYRIRTGSEASFSIYELLRGKDKTVIGTTSDIAGDIRVDGDTLEIGTMTINARTFKTDSANRDGAIARMILKSDQPENEFITFVPTSVSLPAAGITEGEEFSFTVSGNLTISGVTKPVTFGAEAVVTPDAVTGTAEAKIKRSDFNLVVPNLDFIANVPDEFTLSAKINAGKILQ